MEAVAEILPRINIRHNLITPVLGIIDSGFIPNPNVEVSRVFRLPLARFLSDVDHVSQRVLHLRDPVWAHLFNDNPGNPLEVEVFSCLLFVSKCAVYEELGMGSAFMLKTSRPKTGHAVG